MSRRSESDTDYENCNCNKCVKKRREKNCDKIICHQCYQKNQSCKKKQICNCYECRNNDCDNYHDHDNNSCIKKDECQKNKKIIITIN
jgi:hypothetical protein